MKKEKVPGRTVIITGGSGGLGLECARQIAMEKKSWLIILASRDKARTEKAASVLIRETGYGHIRAMRLDLASMHSIRAFTAELRERDFPPLHAVVCNAGIQYVQSTERTEDGFEATFGVNHLGHYLLVHLLLPSLQPHARIVVVSSDTHDVAKKTGMPAPHYFHPQRMADPSLSDRELSAMSASRRGQVRYTTSKLCNLYHVYALHRRFQQLPADQNRMITVNAFNPGMMPGSGLARNYGWIAKLAWNHLLPFMRYFRSTVRSTRESGLWQD